MQRIKMRKKLSYSFSLILPFILIIASSGCISTGNPAGSGQGVIIENFEPDFAKVYAGENFKLQAKVKNIGSVDAEKVYPKLFNVMGGTGQNFEISCQINDECGCANLLAPDPERGTLGGSLSCIWECKAPKGIEKGMTVTFNPSVRLYYIYNTNTIKSITIASQDELRTIQNEGKPLPSETVSTTSGPVQMDIVVNGPIRYLSDEGEVIFPININIQNTGGGTACTLSTCVTSSQSNLPDSSFSQCSRTSSGNSGSSGYEEGQSQGTYTGCDQTCNWNSVRIFVDNDRTITLNNCELSQLGPEEGLKIDLWKGQSKTITCEVVMSTASLQTTGFVQKSLNFRIQYDYFIDASTSVEVIGRVVP
jgi:hypothetical protein